MFTVEDRDSVRDRLLALADADPAVAAVKVVGSLATGDADRWSDLDLNLAVDSPVSEVLADWTERLHREFDAVHHWDLVANGSFYRVFLLPGWLELDLSFTPWRAAGKLPPPADNTTGLAWHHALHVRVALERGRRWQAVYWIGEIRDLVVTMACRRLGFRADYAKGAHLLPEETSAALEPTLVRSLDEPELRRAFAAVADVLADELDRTDPALGARLRPMLAEIAGLSADPCRSP